MDPIVKLVKHRTARHLLRGYCGSQALLAEMMGADGEEVVPEKDILAAITKAGFWGYCDKVSDTKHEIHYWHDGKRSLEELTRFFAHELGHLTGEPDPDDWAEEGRADSFADVATQALGFAMKCGTIR
jgi:hypothetical protein